MSAAQDTEVEDEAVPEEEQNFRSFFKEADEAMRLLGGAASRYIAPTPT